MLRFYHLYNAAELALQDFNSNSFHFDCCLNMMDLNVPLISKVAGKQASPCT